MKIKKLSALLLSLLLVIGMLPSFAVADDAPTKLTALYIKHPLTREFSEMEWLRQAEEIAGVEIEWQEISADWDQIKSTMFASGDIPDLLFTATGDSDYATFDGLFEDLAPLINETDTPNISAFFAAHPEAQNMATMLEGQIYGLPKYQRFWPTVATSLYINQQWLDNLGLATPTTWPELKEVLIAFRDNDANGNGDANDEFPMDFLGETGSNGPGQYHPFMLLGSTGIQLVDFGQDGFFAEDGVIKNAFVDERYKTLVKFLNELYAEGLINPECWTNDYSTYQSVARGNGEYASVGLTWGWESTDRFGLELAGQYTALAPLKISADDNTDVRVEYDFIGLNFDKNRVAMSALSENKEAALRFVDTLYNPEFGLQILWGGMNDIDKGIAKHEDGSYEVLAPESADMDWGTWKWTMTWADGGTIYISDDMTVQLPADVQTVLGEREVYQDCVAKINGVTDIFNEKYMKYTSEEMSEIGIIRTNFLNLCMPNFVAWVTGSQDIDAEWDSYVEQMNSTMELSRTLELKQAAYDVWVQAQ